MNITKKQIGFIALAGVLAYLIFRPKKATAQATPEQLRKSCEEEADNFMASARFSSGTDLKKVRSEFVEECIKRKLATPSPIIIRDPNKKAAKPNKPSKFRLKEDFNTRGFIKLNNKIDTTNVSFKKGEIFEGFLMPNPYKVSIGIVGRPKEIDTEQGLRVRKEGLLQDLFIPSEKLEQI